MTAPTQYHPLAHGLCRIVTNDDGGAYTIREVVYDADLGQWNDVIATLGPRDADALEVYKRGYGWPSYNWQYGVDLYPFWYADNLQGTLTLFVKLDGEPGIPFLVCVTKDGGIEGGGASYDTCSWTYELRDMNAQTLLKKQNGDPAEDMPPLKIRMVGVPYHYGYDTGVACWHQVFGLQLLEVFSERPKADPC